MYAKKFIKYWLISISVLIVVFLIDFVIYLNLKKNILDISLVSSFNNEFKMQSFNVDIRDNHKHFYKIFVDVTYKQKKRHLLNKKCSFLYDDMHDIDPNATYSRKGEMSLYSRLKDLLGFNGYLDFNFLCYSTFFHLPNENSQANFKVSFHNVESFNAKNIDGNVYFYTYDAGAVRFQKSGRIYTMLRGYILVFTLIYTSFSMFKMVLYSIFKGVK